MFVGCIVEVVDVAVAFDVPFEEMVVRVDPSRMILDCDVDEEEPVCVPELLLLAIRGVPLSPKIVVVPMVRVRVADSPVMKERIGEVVSAEGLSVDLVIVEA